MQRNRTKLRAGLRPGLRPKRERGIVIVLVAVVMLFVVGAMAALSIDVVTLYTARSEAQLAADAAALAGARVLANSGATSDRTGTLLTSVETIPGPASVVATQVAEQNQVGGTYLTGANITAISFGGSDYTNPTITVRVQVTTLPTFFARIWGKTQLTVGASATAEAYNPSGARALGITDPVAPTCVKPWLLPNADPTSGTIIFHHNSGSIDVMSNLLGSTQTMSLACNGGNCTPPPPLGVPNAWTYYPGDPGSFPSPTSALPTCSQVPTPTPYQESIAGCIQTPISCNSAVNIDTSNYSARNTETADAVNCLTHATNNRGDTVLPYPPVAPFQFVAGDDDPLVLAGALNGGADIMVSDSLVTVPVINVQGGSGLPCAGAPCPVQIIGFVQLFLNPQGTATPPSGQVNTTVINLAGCGIGAIGTPIYGNGASPVAVRLISPP